MLRARNIYFACILLLIAIFILNFFTPISFYIFGIIIALTIGLLAYGSFNIQADFFAKSLHTPKHARAEVAITFDDGPTAFTSEVLDILKEFDAVATFFCIGYRIFKNREIVKRISEEGHEIGNHTFNHSNLFPFFTRKRMERELSATSQLIQDITEQRVELFRPPFGVINKPIIMAAKKTT